ARLPVHLGDLAAAWPSPARRELPGEVPMLGAFAVLLAVAAGVVALGVVVARAVRRRRPGPVRPRSLPRWCPVLRTPPSRGARWATGRDLRHLRVSAGDQTGRVVLGRVGRTLVATESRHSLLVVGPTQSGKSTALAVPALLEWDGPVVATSVKDDLVAATLAWRQARGRCWVFDPTTEVPASTWSPLVEASTWSGAQRMAAWLVDATPARGGMSDGAFWFASAAKLLAPLLLAASRSGAGMADVVGWNNASELDEPLGILDAGAEPQAAAALAAGVARDPRLRSSIATTLETVLAPFEDPSVARATASCDIDPATLLRGSHSLYLCGPSYEQARVQGLFAALVSSVVAAAVDLVHHQGHPLDPPLLVVLDEVANIAPLRDLDTVASTAAGMGIQLVTVCQDLAQLATRYGPERSRTIANNHRAKIILSGVSDLTTLDLISGLAGDTAVTEETVTRDLRDGRRTRSSGVAFRRLVPTDELRRIHPGDGVLVYGHLPVARLRLRPWYADPVLKRRVPPPPSATRDMR
ncbi:MAG: type IV secretory system conjugative DNA transfer family protein, partial [Actinomycetota bacterium]|nr:type IV secretory system conjugative DNA transfer family protein [Actinomycetota bacterium]